MARGVNKVILIGNLGKDPEAKSFANGGQVCNVSLATSESWKGKDGQQQEHTEWHNLVFNDKLAEIAAKYLRKGSKVFVEGKIRSRKYQDKTSGQDRYITEIRVSDMQMLDGKPGGAGEDAGASYGGPSRASSGMQGRATAAAPAADAGFSGPDDDIPF